MAAIIRGELRELVMTLGVQAITAMVEQERTTLCGPRYVHDAERAATRGGTTQSTLTMGGRKVRMKRPRVTDLAGNEIPLGTWQDLAATDPMSERVLEQMTVGVATRKYARSLEPVPAGAARARHEQERGEPPLRRGGITLDVRRFSSASSNTLGMSPRSCPSRRAASTARRFFGPIAAPRQSTHRACFTAKRTPDRGDYQSPIAFYGRAQALK